MSPKPARLPRPLSIDLQGSQREGLVMRRQVLIIAIGALVLSIAGSVDAQRRRGAHDVPPDQCPAEGVLSRAETLVVEVTPRWRELMQSQHIDWSTEALQADLIGKKVKFTGWLMFDTDHV